MGKISIIIGREYFTRVRNRTFIVMCFVAPLLLAGVFIVPAVLASQPGSVREIIVVDGAAKNNKCAHIFNYKTIFKDTLNLKFNLGHLTDGLEGVKKMYHDSTHCSVFYINPNFFGACDTTGGGGVNYQTQLYSTVDPNPSDVNYLHDLMNDVYREYIFTYDSVPRHIIDDTKREVSVVNTVGKVVATKSEVKAATGLGFGAIIYFYILFFGVMVMKSVVEEKNTRIVEVIISSVRPFQLMLGKIIGVALAGLTQFAVWILLSFAIVTPIVNAVNSKKLDYTKLEHPTTMTTGVPVTDKNNNKVFNVDVTKEMQDSVETLQSIPWGNLIPAFIFYFIFGYLMYASLFAAVGSAVDSDADTSQFSFPLTIPLIISFASSASVLNDPDGPIARWLSMIPFTSPVVMLMRIPYGVVSITELLTSLGILIASFLFMTWLAGRVYRVGILMYGKKNSWRELGKWIFYKG